MEKLEPKVTRPAEIPTILQVPHEGKLAQFAARRWEVLWSGWYEGQWSDLRRDSYGSIAHLNFTCRPEILTYNVMGIQTEGRIRTPTPSETISLVHAAHSVPPGEQHEFDLLRRCQRHFIYNINIWTPEGVYMVLDGEGDGYGKNNIQDGSVSYPSDNVEYKLGLLKDWLKEGIESNGVLFARNKDIAFAPKGTYKTKRHTLDSIAKDGFIIALARGEEGAQRLAELFAKNKKKRNYIVFPKAAKSQTNLVTICALEGDYDNRYLICSKNAEHIGKGFSLGIVDKLDLENEQQ